MRTVLVTGTSSGFGLVATIELARRGWRVLATMRDTGRRAALDDAARLAGVASNVLVSALDVTDAAALDDKVSSLLATVGGRLDAVVHNAGVSVGATFEDLPEREARRIMETNFFGVLALTRALLPVFRAQRSGRIVLVSSDSAFAGEPTNAVYCASKWALEGWAESIAYEVEPFGISIVLVEPGPYRTSIWQNSPRIHPADSPYAPLLARLEPAVEKHLAKTARDPAEVGLAIANVLEARRPSFRNPVGPVARMSYMARGKVPAEWLRRGIARYLGIDRLRL